jgi:hypothetical protein
MVAVGLTFVPVCTMVYVSDCCLPVNADALLLVNGLKVRFTMLLHSLVSDGDIDRRTEYCRLRFPIRCRSLGYDIRLHRQLRHSSGCFCRYHGVGDTAQSIRREAEAQHCAVADYSAITVRKCTIWWSENYVISIMYLQVIVPNAWSLSGHQLPFSAIFSSNSIARSTFNSYQSTPVRRSRLFSMLYKSQQRIALGIIVET